MFLLLSDLNYKYLANMVSMSGNKHAATEGARCTKVPNSTIQSPISSSLYSSLRVPHSLHLNPIDYIIIY